jgi:hypothetical protein
MSDRVGKPWNLARGQFNRQILDAGKRINVSAFAVQ